MELTGMLVMGSAVHADEAEAMDGEALCKLIPRITLENKEIKTFQVNGVIDYNGVLLRFELSGKQPDQVAIRILDPIDATPVVVGIRDTAMIYDPVSMEVLVGKALSAFVLRIEDDLEQKEEGKPMPRRFHVGFLFHSIPKEDKKAKEDDDGPLTSEIDVASFMETLSRPMQVSKKQDGYVLTGKTRKNSKAVAYLTPARKGGALTRFEAYVAGEAKPFLILDQIILNQPIPESRFVFPEKKLMTSALPLKKLSTDGVINSVFSIKRLLRAFMARMVLVGVDDPRLKATVEKMSSAKIDWDQLRMDDGKSTAILKSVFAEDDPPEAKQASGDE